MVISVVVVTLVVVIRRGGGNFGCDGDFGGGDEKWR